MLKKLILSAVSFGVLFSCAGSGGNSCSEDILAPTPPMGWNSWICFGTSLTEDEVKANADFMAENLKEYGWEYIVIDAGWYAPGMVELQEYEDPHPEQLIDEYGRLIVDTEKYPSAAGGVGLRAVADYIHSKGLKLGIHIMRGIPIQAVEQNCPIKGTPYRAQDIVNPESRCDWYFGMVGIDMSRPGAQEYYDSIFELYESWGIDYVKADDLLSPVYAADEIRAIASAVGRMERPLVLSLSPGPAPVENVRDMREAAQLWRISEDFWDNWDSLKEQFALCRKWQNHVQPGHWPDADMLPIGPMAQRAMRGEPRNSFFTEDEQYTLMSLWAMFRSPLMIGCNMPEMDEFTLSLVTNADVIRINQHSSGNRELFEKDGVICWYAEDGEVQYVSVFNTGDNDIDYELALSEWGIKGVSAKELWTGEKYLSEAGKLRMSINAHGVKLFKIEK